MRRVFCRFLVLFGAVHPACSVGDSGSELANAGGGTQPDGGSQVDSESQEDGGSRGDSASQADATWPGCDDQRTVRLVGANGLTEETNLTACVIRPDPEVDGERTSRIDRTGSSLCSPDSASASCGNVPNCHECTTNAACGSGKACFCATGVPTTASVNLPYISVQQTNRCVVSECESSADCNGFACGFSTLFCDLPAPGFYCRTAEDECQSYLDCNGTWCFYDLSKRHWACSEPGGCN